MYRLNTYIFNNWHSNGNPCYLPALVKQAVRDGMPEMSRQFMQQKARRQFNSLTSDFPFLTPVIATGITPWFLHRSFAKTCVFWWFTSSVFPGFCCLQGYEGIFLTGSLASLGERAGTLQLILCGLRG